MTPEQEAIARRILCPDSNEHFDRVARINAPFVLARGEPLRDANGYHHPDLSNGANIVLAYLRDVAKDLGITWPDNQPEPN